ncbi:lipoprotein insertase outer membrane protein LolB [secondary endosymbiont of Ctenarytaina eucalypti]|uniref:Outer-membrane lipoprotein LolB n=1 Tax=secondary endosymbiont of Ctenarytaina eucalypti TaxID=1199245 RepID=J3TXF4_9ENTR|nr:lipoprotein insertase outer membrane protein LolB [secondary endosymbiont of Ctenarytaina eucalypti]AFP84855.1 outer membrane lipoprotein LolB [secondary endosymbiont of Ctenarytaina eucalypti]
MLERHYAVFRFLPLASLLLASCSVHIFSGSYKSHALPDWRSHQKAVSRLTNYQIRGVFAYFSKGEKVCARFYWYQISDDSYQVLLINPLGNTEMELSVKKGMAQLVNNHGTRYVSSGDLEIMFQKLTGISIPFDNLRHWMLGLPGDALDFMLDSLGHLHQVNYRHNNQHWVVTYQGYHSNTPLVLPSHLELCQGENRIQFKIDSWSL